MSTNPCADAMLVRLVEPGRIAAISHYSHDPASSSMPVAVARRIRATAGTAEEVIALRPDLVLASSFTPPAARAAFARAGVRTLYLNSPTTIAASRAQVAEVAAAVGAPGRGRSMVADIDHALTEFTPSIVPAPPRRRPGPSGFASAAGGVGFSPTAGPRPAPGRGGREPSALLFIAGELATGSGTLLDELLTRAGFVNAAARYGLRYTGTLPAELVVTRPPDLILTPDTGGRVAAMRRRLLPGTPIATFSRTLINCGGPSIAPALARLATVRRSLG